LHECPDASGKPLSFPLLYCNAQQRIINEWARNGETGPVMGFVDVPVSVRFTAKSGPGLQTVERHLWSPKSTIGYWPVFQSPKDELSF
jgi:hypothetical protein